MFLRNLDPPKLCNGSRLQIIGVRTNIIETKILTDPATGEHVFIPRIPMISLDMPFQFKRIQYPVKIRFAITINKVQGQSFNCFVVDLRNNCFSHWQLYVAYHAWGKDAQFILLPSSKKTSNIVYPDVLT